MLYIILTRIAVSIIRLVPVTNAHERVFTSSLGTIPSIITVQELLLPEHAQAVYRTSAILTTIHSQNRVNLSRIIPFLVSRGPGLKRAILVSTCVSSSPADPEIVTPRF
jgi:hypothetical protein